MEILLRAALLDWLRADPALADPLNILAEEAPREAHPPWLGITASTSTDWSTKTEVGREVRIALELHLRGDDPRTGAALVRAVEERVVALPTQAEFTPVSIRLLRTRAEARQPRQHVDQLVECPARQGLVLLRKVI